MNDAPKVADAGVVPHEFSCPDGELDEVFIANAFVHIERMGDTAFWIGIEGENKPMLHLNTGVHRGQWYFNIEVDSNDEPHWLAVQRPRKGSAPPPSRRPHDVERITALESENRQLKEQVRKLSAPVSDHEWRRYFRRAVDGRYLDIADLNAWLATRTQEPAQTEGKC